jgi:hypothetical protein
MSKRCSRVMLVYVCVRVKCLDDDVSIYLSICYRPSANVPRCARCYHDESFHVTMDSGRKTHSDMASNHKFAYAIPKLNGKAPCRPDGISTSCFLEYIRFLDGISLTSFVSCQVIQKLKLMCMDRCAFI